MSVTNGLLLDDQRGDDSSQLKSNNIQDNPEKLQISDANSDSSSLINMLMAGMMTIKTSLELDEGDGM